MACKKSPHASSRHSHTDPHRALARPVPPHPALPEYGTQVTTPGGIRYKIQMGSGCICGKIQLTPQGEICSIESLGVLGFKMKTWTQVAVPLLLRSFSYLILHWQITSNNDLITMIPFITICRWIHGLKGTVAWDFLPLVFYMNRNHLSPWFMSWNIFEFGFKFAEILKF